MTTHYGTAVIPARLRRPRDKAKVESAVGVVERQVLAPLRNRTFFNLAELNRAIRQLVDKLNDKPFQKLEGSRRSLFEELDRPALKPLPGRRYEFAEWRKAGVNIDYHVEVDHNYYSVPYALVRKEVKRLQSILDHGLDRVSLEPQPETPPAAHSNVRGPHYFGKEATSC